MAPDDAPGMSLPVAVGISIAAAGTAAAMLAVLPSGGDAAAALANGLLVVAALVATALAGRRIVLGGGRTTWSLLAAAMAAFAIAEGYWFVAEVVLGAEVPALSLADPFYLLGYALTLAAMIASVPGASRAAGWRLGFDALVTVTAFTALAWIAVMGDLARGADRLVDAVLLTAYPALDLALVAFAFVLVTAGRRMPRSRDGMIGFGMLLWALVDLSYGVQALDEGFASGLPLDALWVGGYVAFGLATLVRTTPATARPQDGRRRSLLVYIPVAILVPVSAVDVWVSGALDPALFWLGIVLITGLTGRQLLFSVELMDVNRRLRRRGDELHEAQAVARVGSWEYDVVTGAVEMSPEALRILGAEEPIVRLEDFMPLVPPEDHHILDLTQILANPPDTPYSLEHRIVRPDGETRILLQRGRVIHEGGTPSRVVGSTQDITERRRAEDELRFQARLLRSVGQAVIATDLDGKITYWNPAAEALYGWKEGEVLGRSIVDVTPSIGAREAAAEIMERLLRGKSWVGEFDVRRKDGSTFTAWVRDDPILDADGRVTGAFGVSEDVTARREMEAELAFQAHLLRSVGQAVIATDLDGKITYWNPAAERLYGWTRDEVLGRPVIDVTPAETTREQAQEIMAQLGKGEAWHGEFQVQRRDGTSFLADVHNEPLLDGDRLVGIIGISQDVTERKRMEIDLRERLKELRALVDIATRSAHAQEEEAILEGAVAAIEPAFLHADTWVQVAVGEASAASAGTRPDGPALVGTRAIGRSVGRIEVRYRTAHEAQAIGPFLTEEQSLLDAAAEMVGLAVERLRALQGLEKRENELVAAQRIAGLGSWTWDPATDEATWSGMMYTIFERDPGTRPPGIEDALGFFTADSRARLRSELERLQQEGGAYEMVVEARLPSGTKHLISSGHATQSDDGRTGIIRGTVQDITARHESELALRASETRLKEAQRVAHVGSWELDLQENKLWWSDETYRMFGQDPESFGASYDAFLDAIHPDDREMVDLVYKRAVKQRLPYAIQHRLLLPGGTVKWVEERGETTYDPDGEPLRSGGTVQDITEQRAAHEALQRSEAKFRALFESSHDAIMTLFPPDWRFADGNPAALHLFGATRLEEFTATGLWGVSPETQPDGQPSEQKAKELIRKAIDEGSASFEWMHRRLDGETFPATVVLARVDVGGRSGVQATVRDITQQRQAEEDLRFQADLLAEVRQAVMATDLEGHIMFWNPAAERLYGWSEEEAMGRQVTDILGEEQTPEGTEAEGGSADHWVHRKDGKDILINISSSPMLDAAGRLIGFIGVSQDVTSARATQEQYRDLVEHSPNGITRSTPDGKLDYINPAGARILGFDSPEQARKEVKRLGDLYVDPSQRPAIIEAIAQNDQRPIQLELRRRDGSTIWVETRARMRTRPDGSRIIEGTFIDLTAERAQHELAERLAAIVQATEEGIYSKGLDGVIQTWNPGAERLYGYSADEAIGRSVDAMVIPPDHHEEFERIMARIQDGHVVPRFDTVRRRKDGALIDVSLAVTPIRDAAGKVIGASVSAHDIRDRKRAEEAEKARIENEHLREMDQTLRDFINAAAHDLNQPLTPMKISLATLQDYAEDHPRAQRVVAMLERNVDRMALMLQDLLDVARLESGTLEFNMRDAELDAVLSDAAEFFGQQAREAGITLDVAHTDLRVRADPRRVIQVLFNFVANALKFTPEGGRIAITARATQDMCRVDVTDNGMGLTDEQMSKLFQAFSQVHIRKPGMPKGTGLGLYISRGIIKNHGGDVGVESEGPGKGSTFWFTVPLAGSG